MQPRPTLFAVLALFMPFSGFSFAQQAPPPQVGQQAVERVAAKIKQCGAEPEFGTNPDGAGVMLIGGPVNVIWDIVRVDSVRSPYQAYIEFATPRKFVISDVGRAKHKPQYEAIMMQGAWTQKHRYEFDVNSSGAELRKTLRYGQSDWIDEEANRSCWQNAARQQ